MTAPVRLRLEPKCSRVALTMISLGCLAAMGLTAALSLPWWATLMCALLIAAAYFRGWRRTVGESVPALVHVGIDRTITVTDRRGRSRDGIVDASTYVGAQLTTLVWRADRAPWWQAPGVIMILPDVLPADDFRRLRIYLRYGRCAVEETSGVDAG